MTGWLKLTDEQRRLTVEQAVIRSGINAKAIEKDWWVTLTLKALFQSAYAGFLVFKGGTSLSKCWKLIERFSEDIDIALDPEAFGMSYEENPSKSYVEKLRRKGCEFTNNELKLEIEKQFALLGISTEMIVIEAEPVPEKFPDTDPQVLHVKYNSLFDAIEYLADEVKIEVSVRSLKVPFAAKEVQSILYEVLPNKAYEEPPFLATAAEPRKTFLEKMFLLHEEFHRTDMSKIRSFRMSRHLYDLNRMINAGIDEDAIADTDLYATLVRHREWYIRISWLDYATLAPSTINFIPPDEVMELYSKDYEAMKGQMIYGETEEFYVLMQKLRIFLATLQKGESK
ncbi:MAG TPA: nucleotidyl transferase AbiEii/AbiGii toxin family protein [Chitinophagaceae bacterium]|nr:nucleotidyl transferase AbiEii/AbiGii toxin family protein [Chitinophagaceae bacterium]